MEISSPPSVTPANPPIAAVPGSPTFLPEIFRFLALSMRYPDAAIFAEDYFAALRALLEGLNWEADIRQLDRLRAADVAFIETLQIEYTRLFINAVPHVIAPPYGSVYMDGEGALMSRSTEQIRNFYRERGFELAP